MYTILINNDNTLTTSVRTPLIGDNSNSIQFLYTPPEAPQASQSDSGEEGGESEDQTIQISYSADLNYEICGMVKGDVLVTDEKLYKGRVRFVLPSSAHFWNNRGVIQVWINITKETFISYTDPDTGEVVVERETEYIVTLPTKVFVEEINHRGRCPLQKNPNTIILTRGDSRDIHIALTDSDGYPYIPVAGDEIWFTLKRSAYAEDMLLHKSIDPDTLMVSFEEADTRDLVFGEYKYEVELITQDNDHYTVIKNTPFILTEELH